MGHRTRVGRWERPLVCAWHRHRGGGQKTTRRMIKGAALIALVVVTGRLLDRARCTSGRGSRKNACASIPTRKLPRWSSTYTSTARARRGRPEPPAEGAGATELERARLFAVLLTVFASELHAEGSRCRRQASGEHVPRQRSHEREHRWSHGQRRDSGNRADWRFVSRGHRELGIGGRGLGRYRKVPRDAQRSCWARRDAASQTSSWVARIDTRSRTTGVRALWSDEHDGPGAEEYAADVGQSSFLNQVGRADDPASKNACSPTSPTSGLPKIWIEKPCCNSFTPGATTADFRVLPTGTSPPAIEAFTFLERDPGPACGKPRGFGFGGASPRHRAWGSTTDSISTTGEPLGHTGQLRLASDLSEVTSVAFASGCITRIARVLPCSLRSPLSLHDGRSRALDVLGQLQRCAALLEWESVGPFAKIGADLAGDFFYFRYLDFAPPRRIGFVGSIGLLGAL